MAFAICFKKKVFTNTAVGIILEIWKMQKKMKILAACAAATAGTRMRIRLSMSVLVGMTDDRS
jgi:hypothetical protein